MIQIINYSWKTERKSSIDKGIDFNGMITRLELFYAKGLGNWVHCTFSFTFSWVIYQDLVGGYTRVGSYYSKGDIISLFKVSPRWHRERKREREREREKEREICYQSNWINIDWKKKFYTGCERNTSHISDCHLCVVSELKQVAMVASSS